MNKLEALQKEGLHKYTQKCSRKKRQKQEEEKNYKAKIFSLLDRFSFFFRKQK